MLYNEMDGSHELNNGKRPWYRGLVVDKIISRTDSLFIKMHPNFISILSIILATISYGFLIAGNWYLFFFILQTSYYFDCLDGHVARVTGKSSKAGKILDVSLDFVKIGFLFGLIFVYGVSDSSLIFQIVYLIYCLSVLVRMAQGILASIVSSSAEKRGSAFNEVLLKISGFAESSYRSWCDKKKLNYLPLGVSEQIYLLIPLLIYPSNLLRIFIIVLLFSIRIFQVVITIWLK